MSFCLFYFPGIKLQYGFFYSVIYYMINLFFFPSGKVSGEPSAPALNEFFTEYHDGKFVFYQTISAFFFHFTCDTSLMCKNMEQFLNGCLQKMFVFMQGVFIRIRNKRDLLACNVPYLPNDLIFMLGLLLYDVVWFGQSSFW